VLIKKVAQGCGRMFTAANLTSQGLQEVCIRLAQANLKRHGLLPQGTVVTPPLRIALMQVQQLIDLLDSIQDHRSSGKISLGVELTIAFKCRQSGFNDIRTMTGVLPGATAPDATDRHLLKSTHISTCINALPNML
jgi:hypothetical protein